MTKPEFDDIIKERGKVYGDPYHNHTQIGRAWAALISQTLGIQVDDLPPDLVTRMMVLVKVLRMSKVYHPDNYIDAHIYLTFSESFQERIIEH